MLRHRFATKQLLYTATPPPKKTKNKQTKHPPPKKKPPMHDQLDKIKQNCSNTCCSGGVVLVLYGSTLVNMMNFGINKHHYNIKRIIFSIFIPVPPYFHPQTNILQLDFIIYTWLGKTYKTR